MSERDETGRGDATRATREANEAMAATLAWEDTRDLEEAGRGLIAPLPDEGRVRGADGGLVWDLSRFAFLHEHEESPATVNPSLWRQTRLVVQGGLYEVVPGLYQVRTLDLSNITFAEGDDGIVVFDPLISTETAAAALELYYQHRPRKPVVAVVFSHSHVDHFGGVRGHRRRGRRAGREGQDRRPGGVPRGRGGRERPRRQRDEPARELHVRQPAARRPARPGRRGSRHVDLVGQRSA